MKTRHSRDYNLREVERLVPEGIEHTTMDMWRRFCRHVVDIENDYFEKDGILEDTVMVIELGGEEDDSDEVEDEEDMMDNDD